MPLSRDIAARRQRDQQIRRDATYYKSTLRIPVARRERFGIEGSRQRTDPTPTHGAGTAIPRADRTDPGSAASDPRGEGEKRRRDLGAGLPVLDRGGRARRPERRAVQRLRRFGNKSRSLEGGEARRTVIGDPAYTTWLHLHGTEARAW